jgi:transketolase
MRAALSRLLVEAAVADSRFIVLSGDHGYALFDALRAGQASRFVNVGVCEQNMIGVAAGLAKVGFRPCVYGLAAFVPVRVLEQIKLDLCHSKAPVILIGDGAGLVYSTLGVSHQCGEDIACLRPLPSITIYSPCDEFELEACWREARDADCPSYIRIGKADRPRVHERPLENTEPQWSWRGDAHGRERLIVATGAMSYIASLFGRAHGIPCLSVPRIKPLPGPLVDAVQAYGNAVVVEEHVRAGGLFSAVSEAIGDSPLASQRSHVSHIGLDSRFTTTAGSYEHALSEHELDGAAVSRRLSEWAVVAR